jgi:hypothetical protein
MDSRPFSYSAQGKRSCHSPQSREKKAFYINAFSHYFGIYLSRQNVLLNASKSGFTDMENQEFLPF